VVSALVTAISCLLKVKSVQEYVSLTQVVIDCHYCTVEGDHDVASLLGVDTGKDVDRDCKVG